MAARLLKLAYRLRYHVFAGGSLERWLLALFVLGAAALALTGWRSSAWTAWAAAGLLLLIFVAALVWRGRAARRMYVAFTPQPDLTPPPPQALDPSDKILLHATGQFEVEGKSHVFADVPAYWRSFGTREHAVMGIVHPSRALLLGVTPSEDVGMWYIFFRPETLRSVAAGELTFGACQRPAMAVGYQLPDPPPQPAWRRWLRRPPQPARTVTVYLACDDEPARQSVWADLLADE